MRCDECNRSQPATNPQRGYWVGETDSSVTDLSLQPTRNTVTVARVVLPSVTDLSLQPTRNTKNAGVAKAISVTDLSLQPTRNAGDRANAVLTV